MGNANEKPWEITLDGWKCTVAMALLAIILALAVLGAANLIFAIVSRADYKQEQPRSGIDERLYKARLKYHGLDRRFHSVWEENGQYYFKDDTGRTGKFI